MFPKMRAGRSTSCAGALRAQTVAHMEKSGRPIKRLWSRLTPTGTACSSWAEYLRLMKDQAAYAGELELLAAAYKWKLTVVVIRPGDPTVAIGT
eukprot:8021569-Pyramimonas_sp.AAC.1